MHLKGAKLEEAVFRLEAIRSGGGIFFGTRMGFRTPGVGTLFLGNECFLGGVFLWKFSSILKSPNSPTKGEQVTKRILPHKVSVPF